MGAVEKRNPVAEVCTTVAGVEFGAKVAQALPPGVTVDRFVRSTLTAIQQNPEVVAADRGSLYNAVIRAAQEGLLPDGREAALVIFNGKDGKKVQYMPMIGGLRKRAAEHGFKLDAYLVYENDEFSYRLGFDPVVLHLPAPLGRDRGRAIGAYAVATRLATGQKFLEPPMTVEDIEKVRGVSRAKDRGPWVEWWDEMARKTVARRLFKSLPLIADELTSRTLDSYDQELQNDDQKRWTADEANVAAAIGPVAPPVSAPPDDFIEGHAVEVPEVSEEEPEAIPPVSPADTPPVEPGSSSEPAARPSRATRQPAATDAAAGNEQGSIFERQAAEAQARKRQHKDPA